MPNTSLKYSTDTHHSTLHNSSALQHYPTQNTTLQCTTPLIHNTHLYDITHLLHNTNPHNTTPLLQHYIYHIASHLCSVAVLPRAASLPCSILHSATLNCMHIRAPARTCTPCLFVLGEISD